MFRALWLAAIASNFGTIIQMVGASWVMTTMTSSPAMVASIQTAATLPIMLLALPAGALADTADRRIMMLLSQIIGLISALILAILAFAGLLSPVVLLVLTGFIASSIALHQPSWQATFADLVPRRDLPAAIGINSLAFNIARSFGPALGGLVLAIAGGATAFALNAVSFLGLIFVLLATRLPPRDQTLPAEKIGSAMRAGLRYVAMSPTLASTLVRGGLFSLGGSSIWALTPLIARDQLAGGPLTYGMLLGSFGLGSLLSGLGVSFARERLGSEKVVLFSSFAFAVGTVVIAFSHWLALSMLAMAVCGASWIFSLATISTCVQLHSPRWVVGRAVSISQVAMIGGIAGGAFVWGQIANDAGLTLTFLASAGFLFASLAARWFAPLPGTDETDLTPQEPIDIAPPRVHLETHTGPIIIEVEYQVAKELGREFVSVMRELSRLRRRDGALGWSLQQNLDNPERWVERIVSATWLDHVRRANRSTKADADLKKRAAQFHAPEGTRIRRMVERPAGSMPIDWDYDPSSTHTED